MSRLRSFFTCRLLTRVVGICALLLCLLFSANHSARAQEGDTTVPLAGATQVAVGSEFACALIDDGTVWCWGGGFGGQLGDGKVADSPFPIQVAGIDDAVKISAGNTHACALRANGRTSCWGFRVPVPFSFVADGFAKTPVDIAWAADALDISTVDWQTCALLSDGRVRCATYSYLNGGSAFLLETVGHYTDATALGGMSESGCVLMENGDVNCWKAHYEGYTNSYGTALARRVFDRQDEVLLGASSIASDGGRSCGVVDGALWCWGTGWSPNYATEDPEDATTYEDPILLAGISNVVHVSLNNGLCAHTLEGLVACKNFMYPSTPPTQEELDRFETVPGIDRSTGIGKGRSSACAIVDFEGEGRVKCWGNNALGQLGSGVSWSVDKPVLVAGTEGAESIALASDKTCARLYDGKVACWGMPPDPNWIEGEAIPTFIATIQSLLPPVSAIGGFGVPNSGRICVGLDNGTFSCAGENLVIGFDDGISSEPPPTRALSETTPVVNDVVQIAVGQGHACPLTEREDVYCFGGNEWGQAGFGAPNGSYLSQSIPGMTDVVDVAANDTATCAVRRDGSLWCWGTLFGAGGDFTPFLGYQARPNPSQVLADGVRRVSMNISQVCVALGEEGAQCFGLNENGELGVPQEGWIPPTRVPGLQVVDDVAVGSDQSCFLSQGEVWCVGVVSQRTVRSDGNRNFYSSAVPVQVALPGRALDIEAGSKHMCAIVVIDDHTQVACWGWNDAGQVGANPGWEPVEVLVRE